MKTINFAIDLGTTNSLISKYDNGIVKVYKNPLGLKQTLPSCVSFRENRTVIGDKALDYLEKDAENVCMLFKRKMGSEEVFYVPSQKRDFTPIELSSMILKELKNFAPEEQTINSIVITIPASFDTIQSNATKKAGYMAGFKEVILLQEPIAACLAFANTANIEVTGTQYWIVYDFGGGTFDVALVQVDGRELKVIDNVGDNFLGGADFDTLIVEKLIVPFIEGKIGVKNVWKDLKSKSTKYKGLYFELLKKAEEAKKELSVYEDAEMELDFEIGEQSIYESFTITRSQFETIISDKVEQTISFVNEVISQNQMAYSKIDRIILIGGSTYVPMVRQRLSEATNIFVDASIDPTSAVVEGAAYYAGSKPSSVNEEPIERIDTVVDDTLNYSMFYEQNTKDLEELITFKMDSKLPLSYRLIRKDGGYDSGVKKLVDSSFSEFVPLLEGRLNQFKIQLLDESFNVVKSIDGLAILQGNYNIQGQPLPNDICMEIDDLDSSTTRLEKIFSKGSILPLKRKIYKTASKTILKKSNSNLIINIIEGSANGLPSSGLSIGFIEIFGKDLDEDLIKGTDIEIDLEVSESRDIKINIYLQACDQEFENVFSESERSISISKINKEINTIIADIEAAIRETNMEENFEYSQQLETIRVGLIEIQIETMQLSEDDVSDLRYQLDDKKRKLIQKFDSLTRNKIIAAEIEEYNNAKDHIEFLINQEGNERFEEKYRNLIKNERDVINSGSKFIIRSKIKELDTFYSSVVQSSDENFIAYFINLKFHSDFSDKKKAEKLFKQGDQALDKKDYKSLRYVVYGLTALLPDYEKEKQKRFKDDSRTGLS